MVAIHFVSFKPGSAKLGRMGQPTKLGRMGQPN